jgi:signal transduction histidine kinase
MPPRSLATEKLAALAEFLAAVSAAETGEAAARASVERAAEALDAEVAAIVCGDDVLAVVGYPEGAAPVEELIGIAPGTGDAELPIPGAGRFPAQAVRLEHPEDATLVVARSWANELSPEEAGLLRGMARVTSMTIASVEARAELAASRARVIAAADDERRRVVRDLHDGAQQRLVHTVVALKLAHQALDRGDEGADEFVDEALDHAERANSELRHLVHGILPAVLTREGLGPAVETLARDASLPVHVDVSAGRLPALIEATAYFVVSEALTNAVKHARADSATVDVHVDQGVLRIEVRDDGVGGARLEGSRGLLGLADRLSALHGTLHVDSPPGDGTSIRATMPVPPGVD